MQCACEVTFGWMEIVRSYENSHTGERVTRLLCERCAAEARKSEQASQEMPSADGRDAGVVMHDARGMTL